MLFSDTYKIPIKSSESRLNMRGSKFYGFLFPVMSEQEVKEKLDEIKQKYPDATHWCYAYVLNIDKSNQRFNDDGEPSNTAGRPILRHILANDLTQILVIVVRYFGGKLLGVPGLIEAYGETAKLALDNTIIAEKKIESYYKVTFEYADEPLAWQLSRQAHARIDEQNYDLQGCLIMAIPVNMSSAFEEQAKGFHQLEIEFVKTA